MKQVTIENVKARIAQLETSEQIGGRLPIRHEFEMACLRALVGKMAIESDMHTVIHLLANNEWAEHCTETVLGSLLEAEVTRLVGSTQPAPVTFPVIPDYVFHAVATRWPLTADQIKRLYQELQPAQPAQADTDNTAQQFEALATSKAKPTAALKIPEGLHPDTADLVMRFATALAEKLHRAEQKYGHANGWKASGWYNECLQQLWEHIEKGDPRDVAAYCAFMWHHGWVTTDYDRVVRQALATSKDTSK